jgi:hypothetical protein
MAKNTCPQGSISSVSTVGSPENLARVKWAGTRPALFGPARARAGTAGNGPGPAQSTSCAVLGPGR